jgi:hypothetical protein
MTHKIICTEKYLLIVDDSQITEGDWHIKINKNKVGNYPLDSVNPNKGRYKKIIAHLPLNGASILDGVDLLPPLPDEAKDWARSQWSCEPDDYEDLYYDGLEMGYNAAKEKYVQLIEKQISDFTHDLRESTSNYIKQNCEGALFGLKRLRQSLQQPKMPIGFECEIEYISFQDEGDLEVPKSFINSQGLTQWAGKYTY